MEHTNAPKQKQSIEELLNSVTTYWICPITGIQINASNVTQIENHKNKLIQEEKAKEIISQQSKALHALSKEFKNISSLKTLNEYIKNVISLKNPNISDDHMPTLLVKAMKFTNDDFLSLSDIVPVKIVGLTPETKKMFKNEIMKNINLDNKGEIFYVMKRNVNPLAKAIHSFYVKSSNNKLITVGVKEKEILAGNSEYVELLEQLKTIKDDLHDLKLKHAQVDGRMAKIRKDVLSNKIFIDPSEEKSVNSVNKMKR